MAIIALVTDWTISITPMVNAIANAIEQTIRSNIGTLSKKPNSLIINVCRQWFPNNRWSPEKS